jgi:hypothetical protein
MMPVHPFKLALQLPKPEGEDLEALIADVEEFGFRLPILTWNDQIIDGEVRAMVDDIIKSRGGTPAKPLRIQKWNGKGSLVALIISLAVHRRHMAFEVRVQFAARAVDMMIEEAKSRPEAAAELIAAVKKQEARLGGDPGPDAISRRKWVDFVANLAQVSSKSVERARKIEEQGTPELKGAVEAGKVSYRRAAALADLPAEQQIASIKEQQQKAKRDTQVGELTRAFGTAGKHHDQGVRHVAQVLKTLGKSVECFRQARDAIEGYDARPLLERLRKDMDVTERLIERIEQTKTAIVKEGRRLVRRARKAAA